MRLLLCTYYVCIHVATRWGYEVMSQVTQTGSRNDGYTRNHSSPTLPGGVLFHCIHVNSII